jgi:hypothetical protein
MLNLPWWGWVLVVLAALSGASLGYLSWASARAPMDSDLWEGGDAGTRRLTFDERLYGPTVERRCPR